MSPTLMDDDLTTDQRIGRMVKALLDLYDMKSSALAEEIGMKVTTLSGKLNGKAPWKSSEVERVAEALKVPVPLLHRDPAAVIDDLVAAFVNYRSS